MYYFFLWIQPFNPNVYLSIHYTFTKNIYKHFSNKNNFSFNRYYRVVGILVYFFQWVILNIQASVFFTNSIFFCKKKTNFWELYFFKKLIYCKFDLIYLQVYISRYVMMKNNIIDAFCKFIGIHLQMYT